MKLTTPVLIVVSIFVAAGSFFGGIQYQKNKQAPNMSRSLSNGQTGRPNGQFQGNGTRAGFRPVQGEIIASDANSITVKLPDGSSKIVLLSDKTSINQASEVTKEELKTGEKVAVFGTENTDGSVTAQNVQLNPIMRNMQEKVAPTP